MIEVSNDTNLIVVYSWPYPKKSTAKAEVWEMNSKSRLGVYDIHTDLGSRRIAIDSHKRLMVAGCYDDGTVTASDFTNGNLVWKKQGFSRIQNIRFSVDGEFLICAFGDDRIQFLESKTGNRRNCSPTTNELKGVQGLWQCPSHPMYVLDCWDDSLKMVSTSFDEICCIRKKSFAVLDHAFFDSRVVISEAKTQIYCLDLQSGVEVWQHEGEPDCRAIFLCEMQNSDSIAAITRNSEGESWILVINQNNGKQIARYGLNELNRGVYAFFSQGKKMICANGKILDTMTGNEIDRVEFD